MMVKCNDDNCPEYRKCSHSHRHTYDRTLCPNPFGCGKCNHVESPEYLSCKEKDKELERLRNINRCQGVACSLRGSLTQSLSEKTDQIKQQLERIERYKGELERLREREKVLAYQLNKAVDFLVAGKRRFAPNTTNSDVDEFISTYYRKASRT